MKYHDFREFSVAIIFNLTGFGRGRAQGEGGEAGGGELRVRCDGVSVGGRWGRLGRKKKAQDE